MRIDTDPGRLTDPDWNDRIHVIRVYGGSSAVMRVNDYKITFIWLLLDEHNRPISRLNEEMCVISLTHLSKGITNKSSVHSIIPGMKQCG